MVFACVLGGALLRSFLRTVLPEHHLTADSKDVVKLGMGLIATMAALVLGLLIASAKGSYDTQRNALTQVSANIVLLDRVLAHYGAETQEARAMLHRAVFRVIDQLWPERNSRAAELDPTADGGEALNEELQALSPQNEAQRSLQAKALGITMDTAQTRWLMFEQEGSSIPALFLLMLVFWLTIIFISFGLFAPPNATVSGTLFLCALSVSGAIFLILELDGPFDGLIQISGMSMHEALAHLGQ